MERKRLMICGIGILIIACAIFFYLGYYLFRYPYLTSHNLPPETNAVLVVDFNNDRDVTEKQILNGRDAILIVQPASSADTNAKPWFNSIEAFLRLDIHGDGVLTPDDPFFPRLKLVFLNGRANHKVLPLAPAGVHSISIDRRRLVVMIESSATITSPKHNGVVGLLRMTDGTAYDIWLVHIGQQVGNSILPN